MLASRQERLAALQAAALDAMELTSDAWVQVRGLSCCMLASNPKPSRQYECARCHTNSAALLHVLHQQGPFARSLGLLHARLLTQQS